MRQIKYLSPTSLSLWDSDRTEFYLRYCADNRPPRTPQTRPMAIGAAFDAFVKNYLVGALGAGDDEQFSIEKIFEAQVEPQNRDWGLEHGERLFNEYRRLGAVSDLMLEMSNSGAISGGATDAVRFEFTVENRIGHSVYADGIPILGKPDCHIRLADASLVIDWKVNGYCGSKPTSPKKGYVKERPSGKQHRDCQTMVINGITTNIGLTLDQVDEAFATQLCMYMWVLGEPIPTKALVGIEQLACAGLETSVGLRVASHRCRISDNFQLSLLSRLVAAWDKIQQGWIFTDLSFADNVARCEMLDHYYEAYVPMEGSNEQHEEWFRTITRDR